MTLETIAEGLVFPESPRWHQGALWFSDIFGDAVWRVEPGSAPHRVTAAKRPSGLGWLPDGRMLVVLMEERVLVTIGEGRLLPYADLGQLTRWRCNDMVVDWSGRAYVTTLGLDPVAGGELERSTILLVRPDGTSAVVASDLAGPNGVAITEDGQGLLVAETFAHRIVLFPIAVDGSLAPPRVHADLPGRTPDGICLAENGCLWLASPATRELVLLGPDGEIAETVPVATDRPYACGLGAVGSQALFICTAPSPRSALARRGGRVVRAALERTTDA